MEKKEKGIEFQRIKEFGWEIVGYKNPDGSILYYLNRYFIGKTKSYMIITEKELINLIKFCKKRTIK